MTARIRSLFTTIPPPWPSCDDPEDDVDDDPEDDDDDDDIESQDFPLT